MATSSESKIKKVFLSDKIINGAFIYHNILPYRSYDTNNSEELLVNCLVVSKSISGKYNNENTLALSLNPDTLKVMQNYHENVKQSIKSFFLEETKDHKNIEANTIWSKDIRGMRYMATEGNTYSLENCLESKKLDHSIYENILFLRNIDHTLEVYNLNGVKDSISTSDIPPVKFESENIKLNQAQPSQNLNTIKKNIVSEKIQYIKDNTVNNYVQVIIVPRTISFGVKDNKIDFAFKILYSPVKIYIDSSKKSSEIINKVEDFFKDRNNSMSVIDAYKRLNIEDESGIDEESKESLTQQDFI